MGDRKRKSYTLDEKIKFIREVENNPQKTKTEMAMSLGIAYTTLCTVLNKKDVILAEFSKLGAKSKKRSRKQDGRFPDLEKELYAWFRLKRASGRHINGDVLKAKAIEFAKILNINEEFKASSGWLQGFKDRHGIVGKNTGEEEITEQHWNYPPGIIIKEEDVSRDESHVSDNDRSEDIDFAAYVHCEYNEEVCEKQRDVENATDICQHDSGVVLSDSNVDDASEDIPTPKFSEVLSAIEVCRRYINSKIDCEYALNVLSSLRKELNSLNEKTLKPTTRDNFFKAGPSFN